MAVVINDFEVVPQAAPAPAPAGKAPQGPAGGGPSAADMKKEVEKMLRSNHQRNHRLSAY